MSAVWVNYRWRRNEKRPNGFKWLGLFLPSIPVLVRATRLIISYKPLMINLNISIGYLMSSRGISESNTYYNPSLLTCRYFPLLNFIIDTIINYYRVMSSILSWLPLYTFSLCLYLHNIYYSYNLPFVYTSFSITVLAQVILLRKGINVC